MSLNWQVIQLRDVGEGHGSQSRGAVFSKD